MGRAAARGLHGGRAPRSARLAKKALSICPRPAAEADARPRATSSPGRHGKAREAQAGAIDWLATLLQGRPRKRADLRWRARTGALHESWLVVVDASGSTRRHQALSDAKGLLAQLFDQAYRQRARLTLLTARGERPHWQRQGLKASAALQPWLEQLGAGGGTPLVAALSEAEDWLRRRRKSHPGEQQRCLILTDGRIKPPLQLAPLGCPALLVDLEKGPIRLDRARILAERLGAEYRHIEHLVVSAHPMPV